MAKEDEKVALISTALHGIYIPAALLVFGTAIVKMEWIWYSVALAIGLAVLKVIRGRMFFLPHKLNPLPLQTFSRSGWKTLSLLLNSLHKSFFFDMTHLTIYINFPAEPRKVLKPDLFQHFDLKEKTILSHNTAM